MISVKEEARKRHSVVYRLSLDRDHPLVWELKLNFFLESFLEIIENGLEVAKYLISNQSSIEIEPLEPIRPIPLEAGIVLGRGRQVRLRGNLVPMVTGRWLEKIDFLVTTGNRSKLGEFETEGYQ